MFGTSKNEYCANENKCSYCNSPSDLITIDTKYGNKGFCGPVCLNKYKDKFGATQVYNAPPHIKRGVIAVTPEIKELERLLDTLKKLDYYSTITHTRRRKITLNKIEEVCDRMKIQIDALSYSSDFNVEDNLEITLKELITQYHWTLYNLVNLINTDIKKTKKFIEQSIEILEDEYPELRERSF